MVITSIRCRYIPCIIFHSSLWRSFPTSPAKSFPVLFLFLFLPLPPTRRKTLRDWIKIAGAISRTHDIGENATEALIMADTRRAVAAATFYPLTQDSHYTNVPPIIGPQSTALPLPREPLSAFLNHFNQNHANRRGNQIPRPRRSDTAKISVKRSSYFVSIRNGRKFARDSNFLELSSFHLVAFSGHVRLYSERFITSIVILFI